MAFTQFQDQQSVVQLLQRSLKRGRLAHAYLFNGVDLGELEAVALTLAKTLNCERPVRNLESGQAIDCCDVCPTCRKIDVENYPDILHIRPESKSRVVTVEQMRDLLQTVHLKPAQAEWKVAILSGADRLNPNAANAFLKTLEEPPARSILILLTTEIGRVLETIVSRCIRLNFAGETGRWRDPALLQWLEQFSAAAQAEEKSLFGRYQLLSVLLGRLEATKKSVTDSLTLRSPLERFADIDPKLREKWEEELSAAIEAEYRRQRVDLLLALQLWFRDVWLESLQLGEAGRSFPQLAGAARAVARRLTPAQAMENLSRLDATQRLLSTNVQEALALEVGLLQLQL